MSRHAATISDVCMLQVEIKAGTHRELRTLADAGKNIRRKKKKEKKKEEEEEERSVAQLFK